MISSSLVGEEEMVTSTDSSCLGTPNTTFTNYSIQCASTDDDSRRANIFNQSTFNFVDAFQKEKSEYDELIITGDGIEALASLSKTTIHDVDLTTNTLLNKEKSLQAEINAVKAQGDAADRSFMDNILYGNPESGSAPSLQDVALVLFWFAWIFMVIILVAVRWFSPNGNWTSALFTFSVLTFVTLFVYVILQQVA